ncbi:MAG: SDR family NAD(P)-dependent oxidoreductase [Thermodesulfobacteriota bacterium]
MKTDKVAVILGTGPGLGRALAQKFSNEGYKIAIVSRTKKKLENIQREIESSGGETFIATADVTNEQELKGAFNKIFQKFGKNIDVLVYNAGDFKKQSILKIKPDDFKNSWKINCFGAFLSSKLALPSMLKKKKGTIIFTGATASIRGSAEFSLLAVGKFGLRALAQSIAREFGPKGIHVAHVIIDGQIAEPNSSSYKPTLDTKNYLSPEAIAEQYWQIHNQTPTSWTLEMDLRPATEHF